MYLRIFLSPERTPDDALVYAIPKLKVAGVSNIRQVGFVHRVWSSIITRFSDVVT